MRSWAEPTIEYGAAVDSRAYHAALLHDSSTLAHWPAGPFEDAPTDCIKRGEEYWIWQPGVGGVRFLATSPHVLALPDCDVDREWFDHIVIRGWVPCAYLVWGRQVLHASAVARLDTETSVGFTGPSGAGKSTFAYGLSRRAGWTYLCDDTLAFSRAARHVVLHPIRSAPRLRPASREFYTTSEPAQDQAWPNADLRLGCLYYLAGDDVQAEAARIEPLPASECYTRLLEEANALTLSIPEFNRDLLRDYLHLAAVVPTFSLSYRRSFDVMDEILDAVETHQRQLAIAGVTAAVTRPPLV